MPSIGRLLETALYVEDLARSAQFYKDVFGFDPVESGPDAPTTRPDSRFYPLRLPGQMVLLLFRKGACVAPSVLPGGTIPSHDANGRSHLAFAVSEQELERWRTHLHDRGVSIEGENVWPRGGRSVYFRDPDGHLLELATPGIWSIY